MKARELLPELASKCKQEHERVGLMASGHDFDHDLRVAEYALMIAPDENSGRLAAAAGFCHSIDQILQKESARKPEAQEVVMMTREWLQKTTEFSTGDISEIAKAVRDHHMPNSDGDTDLNRALRDADRLANMDADVIIHSGQFRTELLAVDYVHFEKTPGANYANPVSVYWDVWHSTQWMNKDHPYAIRLPKARELGQTRADFLTYFLQTIKVQRNEIGLVPYPAI